MRKLLNLIVDLNLPIKINAFGIWEFIPKVLSDREIAMISARYIGQKTLKEIGKENKISQERTRQIINRSLRKIRKGIK